MIDAFPDHLATLIRFTPTTDYRACEIFGVEGTASLQRGALHD
ncbi:hypothetical protein [Nitrosomonas supralitoralis]|nr:hypothetical protein [Nitrosomonas supralitoralis]